MSFLQTAPGADVLSIATAISTLTSSFSKGADLVGVLKTRARQSTILAELEKLEQLLIKSKSKIQNAYDLLIVRYGEAAQLGDGEYRSKIQAKMKELSIDIQRSRSLYPLRPLSSPEKTFRGFSAKQLLQNQLPAPHISYLTRPE